MRPFFVYLLQCADGSYYAGHTDELERRIAQHQAGLVAGYTQQRQPVSLVWSQETASRDEALAAELRIKGWSRAKKEALIRGDWAGLSALAKGRTGRPEARPGLRQAQPERSGGGHGAWDTENAERHRPATTTNTDPHPSPFVLSLSKDTPDNDPPTPPPPFVLSLSKDIPSPPSPTQRRALAKGITLLESTRTDHRLQADALLNALLPHSGKSLRLGLSGVPGVGKSTFIEALGLYLIEQGHRVAVLAIDPSSSLSGGSILGDKTRMERLSVHDKAFIRPSPAAGNLGGVAEKTRECILLCEAAGFDVVIVETVGVGQSETAVSGMTDMFVLLQLPNAGDDLQAIKKGVMELADLVVINKADLDAAAATRAQAQVSGALRFLGPQTQASTAVMQLSALKGTGLPEFWQTVSRFQNERQTSGQWAARRHQQDQAWMNERIAAGLRQRFVEHPAVQEALPRLTADVVAGKLAASVAARQLLSLLST